MMIVEQCDSVFSVSLTDLKWLTRNTGVYFSYEIVFVVIFM